jgi:hypothetical protein
MHNRRFAGAVAALACCAALALIPSPQTRLIPQAFARESPAITQGSLVPLDDQGQPGQPCPLKHTEVKAKISSFLARVVVTQQFENPQQVSSDRHKDGERIEQGVPRLQLSLFQRTPCLERLEELLNDPAAAVEVNGSNDLVRRSARLVRDQ